LPGGGFIARSPRQLCFEVAHAKTDYEYQLSVPGSVDVPELGVRFEAILLEMESVPQADREYILNPACLPKELTIRNWRPGDRFWPAHTKHPAKVKELLSEHHISGSEKKRWPVV